MAYGSGRRSRAGRPDQTVPRRGGADGRASGRLARDEPERSEVGGRYAIGVRRLLAAFTGKKTPPPDTPVQAPSVVTGFHPGVLAEPLSVRELDVLRLLSHGRSNAEIARELFVEQSTVKTHLIHLYRKLDVSSRTQAISRARTLGLLD
jgi:DNA-binding CsgD family transcriptional regulator